MNWLKTIFRLRRRPQEEEEKPFLEHMEDLRWTLLKMGIALAVCMIAGFVFRYPLAELVQRPLVGTTGEFEYRLQQLQAFNPLDNVNVSFKLAFYAGLVLAFPLLLYYLAEFLLPGLTPHERRMLVPVLLTGTVLFIAGVLFCYYVVLPVTLDFFYRDQERFGWKVQWGVKEYYSFVTQFSLGFGLCFELPLVVILLVKAGFLNFQMMSATRAHAWVVIMALAAIITPTVDVLSLLLMGLPLILLYELCIWISFFMGRARAKRDLNQKSDA